MLTNMQPRERVHIEEFCLSIRRPDGSGFSFPCTADGEIVARPWSYAPSFGFVGVYGYANMQRAISWWMDEPAVTMQIEDYSRYHTQPAHGTCTCGEEVYLYSDYGHGTDCECGRIYNLSGQELAPRSQWEDRYEDDDTMSYAERFGYAGRDD